MSDLLVIAAELERAAKRLRELEVGGEKTPEARGGKLLALARNEAGYSQAHLSELSGVSTNAIINIETGKTKPRARTLMALAEHLDVPWQWLREEEASEPE